MTTFAHSLCNPVSTELALFIRRNVLRPTAVPWTRLQFGQWSGQELAACNQKITCWQVWLFNGINWNLHGKDNNKEGIRKFWSWATKFDDYPRVPIFCFTKVLKWVTEIHIQILPKVTFYVLYLYFIITDRADCWMRLTEAGKED